RPLLVLRCSLVVPSLFFHVCLLHLPPHSFPTRRSSDLPDRVVADKDRQWNPQRLWNALPHGYTNTGPAADPPDPSGISDGPGQRSEEHTSELQSRFDLVCRLLLEKKKLLDQPHTTSVYL